MTVALERVAMRLSELAIMYLATAAPFGVAHFLGRATRAGRRGAALAASTAAALLWPLTAARLMLAREGVKGSEADACSGGELKIERARRAAVNALRAVEDELEGAGAFEGEAGRQALYAAREAVERYAGLASACAAADISGQPTARETEMFRVAGREGEDLLVAGRCVRRRNVARLFAHLERARRELVHALAAVREEAGALRPAPSAAESSARGNASAALRVSETTIQALARAVELLSLFDDHATVLGVARLLDAECARLRRLGADAVRRAPELAPKGGETCTTPAAHAAFVTPAIPTTTSSRG